MNRARDWGACEEFTPNAYICFSVFTRQTVEENQAPEVFEGCGRS
jgi:hypothetical protein